MSIEPKYVRRTEGLTSKNEIVDFPYYFLDLLLADDKLSRLVVAAKLGGGRGYHSDRFMLPRRGKISWENMPDGTIFFDPFECFISATTIRLGKLHGVTFAHMFCATPELRHGSFGNIIFKIKIEYEGFFGSGKVVGIEVVGEDRNVPGLSDIKNDKNLLDRIYSLLRSGMVRYEDFKGDPRLNEIRFSVLRNPFRWIGGGKETE